MGDLRDGIRSSLPIAMGYFPVSFTFGMIASGFGVDAMTSFAVSATNFTSAGQFAGLNVMVASGSYMEVAVTTFVINIRYMLMSLSLSQKMESLSVLQRLLIGFGITDETFAVSSIEKDEISFPYMGGLIILPYLSWGLGTLSGALISELLSARLKSAMGIALYGMFLAIIIPEAKRSRKISSVISMAVVISLVFRYTKQLADIPQGWVIIVATIIASTLGAILFPMGRCSDE